MQKSEKENVTSLWVVQVDQRKGKAFDRAGRLADLFMI